MVMAMAGLVILPAASNLHCTGLLVCALLCCDYVKTGHGTIKCAALHCSCLCHTLNVLPAKGCVSYSNRLLLALCNAF